VLFTACREYGSVRDRLYSCNAVAPIMKQHRSGKIIR
jgi:hypothetical protein